MSLYLNVPHALLASAGPYSPIPLPMISFMSPERGTRGHDGSSEGTDFPQMSLFEDEADDQS
jgi:hypothetical protein